MHIGHITPVEVASVDSARKAVDDRLAVAAGALMQAQAGMVTLTERMAEAYLQDPSAAPPPTVPPLQPVLGTEPDWTTLPMNQIGYYGGGSFDQKARVIAGQGGVLEDMTIVGSQQACLINSNIPGPYVVSSIQLERVRLRPNPMGTYWGARIFGTPVFEMADCVVEDMFHPGGKPEGHGVYLNPAGITIFLRTRFSRNAGNPIQAVVRPLERGGPSTRFEVLACLFEENHTDADQNGVMDSDRAANHIDLYGLGPDCVISIKGNRFVQTASSHLEKDGSTYYSRGLLTSTPVGASAGLGWSDKLLEFDGNTALLRKPSQSLLWTSGAREVRWTNNDIEILDGGKTRLDICPPLLPGLLPEKLVIASNSGATLEVYVQNKRIGDTSETIDRVL